MNRSLLAVSLAVLAGCGRVEVDPATEGAILAAILGDVCTEAFGPVYLRDVAGELDIESSQRDYLERSSDVVSSGLLWSFGRRNGRESSLKEVAAPQGRCEYLSVEQFTAFQDTATHFQLNTLPPPGTPMLWPPRTTVALSRVGLNWGRDVALVHLSWAGGYGQCRGDYHVLRLERGQWSEVEAVPDAAC